MKCSFSKHLRSSYYVANTGHTGVNQSATTPVLGDSMDFATGGASFQGAEGPSVGGVQSAVKA